MKGSLEISELKGRGWKSVFDARDFRALRDRCITNKSDSVLDMNAGVRNTS